MDQLTKLINKLSPTIVRNDLITTVMGGFANSLDNYQLLNDDIELNLIIYTSRGSALNIRAEDYGLNRNYRERDAALRLRVQNSYKYHQYKGSLLGIEIWGSEKLLISPYPQRSGFVIGDPIADDKAIGDGFVIHIWNSSDETQSKSVEFMRGLLPINTKIGIDYISDQYEYAEMSEVSDGSAMLIVYVGEEPVMVGGQIVYAQSDEAYLETDGFALMDGLLIPTQDNCWAEWGDRDLGSNFADSIWMIDWLNYVRWDVDYKLTIKAKFSDDQLNWSEWKIYNKNDWILEADINQYVKFRAELIINDIEDFQHFAFRRFILKSLTEEQSKYGGYPESIIIKKLFLG